MNIGTIGAGHMARALTTHFVKQGHAVMLSNARGPASLADVATELRCRSGTPEEAAAFGTVLVLAIPLRALRSIPAALLSGKTIVDLVNYYPGRDGAVPELDAGETTTSEMVARHFAGAHIVKAFNSIMVADLRAHGTPPGTAGRRALPMAGDNAAAKSTVSALVDACGFDVVDTGSLADSWRFERARPTYCIPLDREALERGLALTQRDSMVAEGSWHRRPPAA